MLAVTVALLSLVAASVPDEGRLLTRQDMGRIVWRHPPSDRRTLVTCGGGPYVGARNGDKLTLYVQPPASVAYPETNAARPTTSATVTLRGP